MRDSTAIFIDFHKNPPKTLCFSVVSRPAGAQVPIFIAKMKNTSKKDAKSTGFLTFRNRRSRKYGFLLFKNQFLSTSPDPGDPDKMEHELRLATHQQRAGGQDDVSLNKLPQINQMMGKIELTIPLKRLPTEIVKYYIKCNSPFLQSTCMQLQTPSLVKI